MGFSSNGRVGFGEGVEVVPDPSRPFGIFRGKIFISEVCI